MTKRQSKEQLSKTIEKLRSDNETLASRVEELTDENKQLRERVEMLTRRLREIPVVYTREIEDNTVKEEGAEAVIEVAKNLRT